MQYSALTVKPTIIQEGPVSFAEAAKRMGKFLKKVRLQRITPYHQRRNWSSSGVVPEAD